jgi:LysM repeat protein
MAFNYVPRLVGGALCAAALLLAGCSGGDASTEAPSESTPTPSGTATITATAPATDTTPSRTPGTGPTGTRTPTPTDTETGTPEPEPVFYVVQDGDTLWDIAQQFGVTVDDIVAANNLPDAAAISIGQELYIPVDGDLTPRTRTPTPTPSPTATPRPPTDVNGVAIGDILDLDDAVVANMREIYSRGIELGNDPRAFSKVGDSTIENPHFVTYFDTGAYNLGDYAYLQDAVDHYQGSFDRDSIAVHVGLHSWSMFDPMWAEGDCLPNEGPVPCEIRLHRPSLLLIRLGSNDAGVPDTFEENMRKVVEYAIEHGVIPVLATKGDRHEGSNVNNEIIKKLAYEYVLPLWDWDRVADTLPNRGIDPDDPDGVHLTFFTEMDYTLPEAYERGHGMHNLTALIALYTVWRELGDSN